jgi:hypothetical protein
MKIINVKEIKIIANGLANNGSGTPRNGPNVFINNPMNITNATLRLTDSRSVSVMLFSVMLRAPKMTNPGINVR